MNDTEMFLAARAIETRIDTIPGAWWMILIYTLEFIVAVPVVFHITRSKYWQPIGLFLGRVLALWATGGLVTFLLGFVAMRWVYPSDIPFRFVAIWFLASTLAIILPLLLLVGADKPKEQRTVRT